MVFSKMCKTKLEKNIFMLATIQIDSDLSHIYMKFTIPKEWAIPALHL